jgi:uncharacterized protein (TIGR02266 family)
VQDIGSRFREFAHLDKKRAREGLSPEELQRWTSLKQLLEKKFSPCLDGNNASRRASVRVPTRLAVQFGNVGELQQSLMTNLSRGGVFIATDHPVEMGARFDLWLGIGKRGKEMVIPVEVVSHNMGPRFEKSQRGMGLRFVELTPEIQTKIDEFYETALKDLAKKTP